MPSNSCLSLAAFVVDIVEMFSDKMVCRQLKCLPSSDFSTGMDRFGIQPSSASGLEICRRKVLIALDSSSSKGFKNSMLFSLPSYRVKLARVCRVFAIKVRLRLARSLGYSLVRWNSDGARMAGQR